ncbi:MULTISPECIES: tryptophan halogenase family protein [Sphingomonas]|jgi:tryptophan halogenase|uniref:Tryptophan halogenase n=1 Tax=Sphingomonas turrisvirgatae TaxID=1888892 RepID=A0A1E3LYW1_9SPHN|nr:tryptophan halogenase family protein [Sphingomonas turrisvirgatae]ODP38941.1 tryptophan halogenase [Sphingomonas turrisvirgatae]
MEPVTRIVIVGGGTAGWLTAGTLAAATRESDERPLEITLVESPNVPIIGVGEGTWPTMRRTLKRMGIRETDFLNQCSASFKQGAQFVGWVDGSQGDAYYHPLVLPQGYFETNMARQWLAGVSDGSFAAAVCPQEALCEAGRAPKAITTAEYDAVANYAYHLDAGAFSRFLQEHCTRVLGVRHVAADVTGIRSAENGDIAAVLTMQAGEISGDLFIDCTGFRALLLGEHFGVGFIPWTQVLFADRALAVQVPYPAADSPILPHTLSTAQRAGWIWDIGLQSRRGVGHVYSSAHIDDDAARADLRAYVHSIGGDAEALPMRKIEFQAGHRTRFWERNCVAVGLSAGFLEPLEASAILLVEIAAQFIAEQMPATRAAMDPVARRYNTTFAYRWARIIDFLKLHYLLSRRTEPFWADNRRTESIPESLTELLTLWREQPPWHDDFDRAVEVFPAASYQYVLYGMGFETRVPPRGLSSQARAHGEQLFMHNKQEAAAMIQRLPSTRDLLDRIARYGLQPV